MSGQGSARLGGVVVSVATSHVLFASAGVEDAAARVVDGMRQLGETVLAARPDVIVTVASDHGRSMPHAGPQAAFAIGITDEFTTLGDMAVPQETFASDPDLATGFVRHASQHGYDFAVLETFSPDHGTAIPALVMFPERQVPIVPVFVNANHPVVWPLPARVYALGKLLADYAATGTKRIAVVGTGGLSHWPGMPEMGRINPGFDRAFLADLAAGRAAKCVSWTYDYILEHAGNGGLEINNWLFAAGAAGDRGGDVVYYEAIEPWYTGMGGFAFAT